MDNTALPSQGNIYIANREELLGYDAAGNQLAGFPIPKPGEDAIWTAVAVDPSGNVWAADFQRMSTSTVRPARRWTRSTSRASLGFESYANSLDFDSSGDLYLGRNGGRSGSWRRRPTTPRWKSTRNPLSDHGRPQQP